MRPVREAYRAKCCSDEAARSNGERGYRYGAGRHQREVLLGGRGYQSMLFERKIHTFISDHW